MPWNTLSLRQTRERTRAHIAANIPNSDALVPNAPLRVLADANAGNAHLNLQYLDWQSRQFLPVDAEVDGLFRWGEMLGLPQKAGVAASGSVTFTGTEGVIVPAGTRLRGGTIEFETLAAITLGTGPTNASVRALDPGAAGNLAAGVRVTLVAAISGVNAGATVVSLTGGADDEAVEDWRLRILERMAAPPHGGALHDYPAWAKQVPGVTRAWATANGMGIGTVVLRFMMDELRATSDGLPNTADIAAVTAYLDTVRPVCTADRFVIAPTFNTINFGISNLAENDAATQAAIVAEVKAMLFRRGVPGGMIWRSWMTEAIAAASGEDHHDHDFSNLTLGVNELPKLGTITFA